MNSILLCFFFFSNLKINHWCCSRGKSRFYFFSGKKCHFLYCSPFTFRSGSCWYSCWQQKFNFEGKRESAAVLLLCFGPAVWFLFSQLTGTPHRLTPQRGWKSSEEEEGPQRRDGDAMWGKGHWKDSQYLRVLCRGQNEMIQPSWHKGGSTVWVWHASLQLGWASPRHQPHTFRRLYIC